MRVGRRVTRREFLKIAGGAAALGAGGTVLSSPGRSEAANVLDSSPAVPYESPVTPERVEFLSGRKPYIHVALNVMLAKAPIGNCVKYHIFRWGQETGARVNFMEVPVEALHHEIFADLTTGAERYDGYMTAAWFYGDFFVPMQPYIVPLDDFITDRRHPFWVPTDQLASMRTLYTWDGRQYGTPLGADCQILYFREDILTRPDYRTQFKSNYGYDLPAPPKTVDQMHDIADFFTGWDWNGDSQIDWGMAPHAITGELELFDFLTLAAPFIVSPDNKSFWFSLDTMEPYVNSEGLVRALEDYARFAKNGTPAMLQGPVEQAWQVFLAGHSIMAPAWGDLAALAQDQKTSKIRGKVGAAPIPGTKQAFNPATAEWKTYPSNQVTNLSGGSWHLVLSRFSKNKEAMYDLMAFLANNKNAVYNATNPWTGVRPSTIYEYPPPHGTGRIEEYVKSGWHSHDIKAFLDATYTSLTAPLRQTYLRIPGTSEYLHELAVNVSAVLAEQMTPRAALDDVAKKWQKITDRRGRDTQLAFYRKSIGTP